MATVTHRGGPLALVSVGLAAFLLFWEDGGRTSHTVYADRLAGGLPTACYGITRWTSPVPVVVGEVWSQEKCDDVFRGIVERTQRRLLECINVAVQQPVFDALTSHAHNFGVDDTCDSQAVVAINDGRIADGCDLIAQKPNGSPNWSYVAGVYYQGLQNRRQSERRLCLQGAER